MKSQFLVIRSPKKHSSVFCLFLAAIIAFCSFFLAVHNFSHKFSQIEITKTDIAKSVFQLQKSNSKSVIFAVKKIFNHGNFSHDLAHCSWCFVVSIYNQIVFLSLSFVVFAAFYFSFLARDFDRVKLAHINSSSLSRAPPFVS